MLETLLKKHWKFDSFRPQQREIIVSIMQGNDTLALLPTGGGKSLCYQLPALAKEGVCFVFSPLIALMKDQVSNLKKMGISAVALHSGLNRKEIEAEMQNTLNGKYKLVYLSPERASSQHFRSYLINIPVSFFVVDESHCISQWGHQFRPEYLRIGELRSIAPQASIVAVSATATKDVILDIKKYLFFKDNAEFFKSSFVRKNLNYLVINESNKTERIVKILSKLKGTAVIYANTRAKCEEVSEILKVNSISSEAYHGGLENGLRSAIQDRWMANKTRVVVCTNAFGMGIDKPDVRLVIHYEIPQGPEAYYQEAGRAGRDGNTAYCVLLSNNEESKASWNNFPSLNQAEHLLSCLYNFHQIAFTAGKNESYQIDVFDFANNFRIPIATVKIGLELLHSLGFVKLNEHFFELPKVKFIVNQTNLYTYQVGHKVEDMFIKLLLRSYSSLFDHYASVNFSELAKRQKCGVKDVMKQLKKLNKDGIIDFVQGKEGNSITYLIPRPTKIVLDKVLYLNLINSQEERFQFIKDYAQNRKVCREKFLLKYFDEDKLEDCGKCDICRLLNKLSLRKNRFDEIVVEIKKITVDNPSDLKTILNHFKTFEEKKIAIVIKWLLENEYITKTNRTYTWSKNQE